MVTDESISDSHVTLEKREAGWFVVDMDSTNGTYVAGQRIVGEGTNGTVADVRLGGIKMRFRTAAAATGVGADTRVIVGVREADSRRSAERAPAIRAERDAILEAAEQPRSLPIVVWIAAFLLPTTTILFVLQGR